MSAAPARIGVIGLGIMGGTMARALHRAGHPVRGHDPLAPPRQRCRRAAAVGHMGGPDAGLGQEQLHRHVGRTALPQRAEVHAARLRPRPGDQFGHGPAGFGRLRPSHRGTPPPRLNREFRRIRSLLYAAPGRTVGRRHFRRPSWPTF